MRPRIRTVPGRPRLIKDRLDHIALEMDRLRQMNGDQAIAITGLKAALAGARGEIEDIKEHHRKQLINIARLR